MMQKELVAASAEPLVLSLLERGENYGYAMAQAVRQLSNEQIEWSDGMLYPVLHRLERRGQIRSRLKVAESGRRWKYYSINKKGRAALADMRRQWLVVHSALSQLWRFNGAKA